MKTVAQVVARSLREVGIEFVFGLPGGENVAMLDATRREKIRFVLTHNEASALFMADAASRITGKPGACLVTLGPGAASAVVGVAHAFLDRSPLLVLTAQVSQGSSPRHTHQFIDLGAIFAPITKCSVRLQATGAYETVQAALRLAQAGRPGPVHLQISGRVAARLAVEGESAITSERVTLAGLSEGNRALATELLAKATRPIIVAGLGLEPERPYLALRRLAEAANAPVIATPKAKGCLPDDHPLAAGTIGLTRSDPVYELLEEADCILAVGFDVVELVRSWDQPQPLLWIAPWPNEDPTLQAAFEFVGPITPLLEQLAEVPYATAEAWGAVRVAAYHERLETQALPPPMPGRVLPQTVLRCLRDNLPREAVVSTDVGSHKILAALTWPVYTPNTYLVANGLSPMGFGLPAAIAASLVAGDRQVVCLTGDGGLAMVQGELALLAELQTPVIVVLFRDDALDLIRSHQVRAGYLVHGTEFSGPDWVQVAQAYGIEARRVTTDSACAEAARAALDSGGPFFIEAWIDPISYPTTPEARGGPARGGSFAADSGS